MEPNIGYLNTTTNVLKNEACTTTRFERKKETTNKLEDQLERIQRN